MGDPVSIALRFLLYTDLMVLFGLAGFGLYSLRGDERRGTVIKFVPLLVTLAAGAILLSIASFFAMTMVMSGAASVAEAMPHLGMMLLETEMGYAWLVRITALTIAACGAMLNERYPVISLLVTTLAGAIALATLAWTGHGAMDEGSLGFWHLVTDILHLWAAGAWVGALAAFALLLRVRSLQAEGLVHVLSRSLTGFEKAGAVIVGVISVTGVLNYLLIVGPRVDEVLATTYGQLLLIKIALFVGMLGFASLNRFRLSPQLERSLNAGSYQTAVAALRRSMALELSLAIFVLGLVAWLGTLSPIVETALP